jgi:hypothetical protein
LKANDLPENLKQIRLAIESEIPHGRSDDGGPHDVGSWRSSPPQRVIDIWKNELLPGYKKIIERSPDLVRNNNVNHINHLGTLGTGNHFLEISLDEEDRVWFMLHSGSRGVRLFLFFLFLYCFFLTQLCFRLEIELEHISLKKQEKKCRSLTFNFLIRISHI